MPEFLGEQTVIYLIYCGMAVGVLLAFTALTSLLRKGENMGEVRSRRLRMIREGRSVEERLALLKPPSKADRKGALSLIDRLETQLRRTGLRMTSGSFLLLCLGLAIVCFAALFIARIPLPLAGLAALAIGFGLPLAALQMRVQRQTQALILQLPDALDLMARGLKVGHPLNTSIAAVAAEMLDPIGTEFGIIYDQITYGEDLPEAVQDFADRVDVEDIHYLSASIGIQHGTGSDLSRVIEVLAKVIRGRIMMRRKVRALSSEGRASATILSALPILMFVFASISSPNYYRGVYDDPMFIPMATAVVLLTVMNALILRKLVNFHV